MDLQLAVSSHHFYNPKAGLGLQGFQKPLSFGMGSVLSRSAMQHIGIPAYNLGIEIG